MCSFVNGARKVNVCFAAASFSFALIISRFMASFTLCIPIRLILSLFLMFFKQTDGNIHVVKPSFTASFTLCCTWVTALTSPDKPTSPNITVLLSISLFLKLLTSAITIPRSRAGSVTFMPPATFTYASLDDILIPALFFKNSHKKIHSVIIRACCCTSWHAKIRITYKCLHFYHKRPCSFNKTHNN